MTISSRLSFILCMFAVVHLRADDASRLRTNNALNVSWGDQIVVGEGIAKLDTPAHIAQALERWQAMGHITTVYWRISSWILQNYHDIRRQGFEWYHDPLERIERHCDPRTEALRHAHRLGMRIYGYMTIFDEGCPASVLYGDSKPFPWQSHVTIENPGFLVCDRGGDKRHWGVMEYHYPEVRRYKIGQALAFLDAYDYDGIYICTRSHSPPAETADMYGFNEPVRQAFRKRHGVDILTDEFDVQAWRDLRGEGLTLFFRELRAALNARGKRLAVGVPRMDIIGPPYGNMTLAWRTWVREELIDELVVGVSSGNFHYPSQRGRDRQRGYLASHDEHVGLKPRLQDLRTSYGPLCRAHGVILRRSSSSPVAVPPLDGHMIGAMSFGSHQLALFVTPHQALDLQTPSSTVDLWVNPAETADFPRLLSKYDHTLGDDGRGWEIMLGDNACVVFRVAGPGFDRHVRSRLPAPADTWTHIACGIDRDTRVFIRINGQDCAAEEVRTDPPRTVPVALRIGCYGGGGRPFKGRLAGIRIWDRDVAFAPAGIPQTNAAQVLFQLAVPADGLALPAARGPDDIDLLMLGDVATGMGPGPNADLNALRFGDAPEN